MTIIEKAKQQSQKIKQILEDWYPHLKGPWKYCSMLYCEGEMSEKLQECGHCLDFIAQGPEDLLAKVKVMDEKMPNVPSYLGKYSRVPNKRTGRLLENEKKSHLYALIRNYTFINFQQKVPPIRLFPPILLLTFVLLSNFITFLKFTFAHFDLRQPLKLL
jgi:hypothetical protein